MFKSQVHQHSPSADSCQLLQLSALPPKHNPDTYSTFTMKTPLVIEERMHNSSSMHNLQGGNQLKLQGPVHKLIKKIQTKNTPPLHNPQHVQVPAHMLHQRKHSLDEQRSKEANQKETNQQQQNLQVNQIDSTHLSDHYLKYQKYYHCFKNQNNESTRNISPNSQPLKQSESSTQSKNCAKPPKDSKNTHKHQLSNFYQQEKRDIRREQNKSQYLDYQCKEVYTRENSSQNLITIVPKNQRSGSTFIPLFNVQSKNTSKIDNSQTKANIKHLLKQIHSKKSNSKIRIPLDHTLQQKIHSPLQDSKSLGSSPVLRTMEQPFYYMDNLKPLQYMTLKHKKTVKMQDSQEMYDTPVLQPSKQRQVIYCHKQSNDNSATTLSRKNSYYQKHQTSIGKESQASFSLPVIIPKSPDMSHNLTKLQSKLKQLGDHRRKNRFNDSEIESSTGKIFKDKINQKKMIQMFTKQIPKSEMHIPLIDQLQLANSVNQPQTGSATYRADKEEVIIAREGKKMYIKISPTLSGQTQSLVSEVQQSQQESISQLMLAPHSTFAIPQLFVHPETGSLNQSTQNHPIMQQQPQLHKMLTINGKLHFLDNQSSKQSTTAFTLHSLNVLTEFSTQNSNHNILRLSSSSLTRFDTKNTNKVDTQADSTKKQQQYTKMDRELLDTLELSMTKSTSNNNLPLTAKPQDDEEIRKEVITKCQFISETIPPPQSQWSIKEADSNEEKESSSTSNRELVTEEQPIKRSQLFNKKVILLKKSHRRIKTEQYPYTYFKQSEVKEYLPPEQRYEDEDQVLCKDSVILETTPLTERTVIQSKSDIKKQLIKPTSNQWLLDSLQFNDYLEQTKKQQEAQQSSNLQTQRASLCDTVLFDNSITVTPVNKQKVKVTIEKMGDKYSTLERSTIGFTVPKQRESSQQQEEISKFMTIDVQNEGFSCQKSKATIQLNTSSSIAGEDFSALYSAQQSVEVNKALEPKMEDIHIVDTEQSIAQIYKVMHVDQEEHVVLQPKYKQPILNRYILPSFYDIIYMQTKDQGHLNGPSLEVFKFN